VQHHEVIRFEIHTDLHAEARTRRSSDARAAAESLHRFNRAQGSTHPFMLESRRECFSFATVQMPLN